MSRTLILDIGLFEPRCGSILWSEELTFDLLNLICRENLRVLACGRFPSLYQSGVRYKKEPHDKEIFMTIPAIIRDGGADCEDLCGWRVAELRAQGEQRAKFVLKKMQLSGRSKRADGTLLHRLTIQHMIGNAHGRLPEQAIMKVGRSAQLEEMEVGALVYHVQVMRANGQIEDPSALLGMNGGR